MYQQLELQLNSTFQSGDVVKLKGRDQLGYGDWTDYYGVVNCFPQAHHGHLMIWLVGYYLTSTVPLVLPFTPDQLKRTGQKHKTTWQYKTERGRKNAKL